MDRDLNPHTRAKYLAGVIRHCFPTMDEFTTFITEHRIFPRPVKALADSAYEDQLEEYAQHVHNSGNARELVLALFGRHEFLIYFVDLWGDFTWDDFLTLCDAPPNWDDLSGMQLKIIRDAIEKAFPNPSDFDIFLSDTFNKRPLTTQSAAAFPQQLFKFLLDVQAEGWSKELVGALEATKRVPVRNLTGDLEKAAREPS